MGKQFKKCVREGGRVRTVKPSRTTYQHVCFHNGKSYAGEVKRIKTNPSRKRAK